MNQENNISMQSTKRSKVVKWSLIAGIVIVLNLFFGYALSLAYPTPDYQTFCPDNQVVDNISTKATCVANGGQWTENVYPATKPSTPDVQGYCNPNFTCQKQYDAASKTYSKNIFIVLVVLGIVSVAVGVFVKNADVVSIGLSFGGVLSLVIASIRYWSEAGNILKVIILGIALAALLWLGLKKFKNS